MRASAVLWTLVTLLTPAGTARAETLRLSDAIAVATRANPQITIASTAVDEADAAVRAARGAYEPVLVGALTATAAAVGPPSSARSERTEASLAVVKATERGGQLRFAVVGTNLTEHSPMRPGATWAPRLEGEWQQPLLGGRRAGRLEVDGLTASREAAIAEGRADAIRAIRDVEQAYWRLYLAQRELEIRRQTAALAEAQLERTRIEITRGTRPPLAEAEFDEELVRRRDDAFLAASLLSDRSLELARLLGLPATTELRAGDSPQVREIDPADLPARAVATSPELRALQLRDRELVAGLAAAADATAMRFDAVIRGSVAAQGTTATNDTRFDGWSLEVGVSVRLPLGNAARRGAVDGAHARLERVRLGAHDVAETIRATALRELERLGTARTRRTELERSIRLAELSLTAEQRRWERGDSTPFDVLRRQSVVGELALRAERARLDQVIATIALESLTGDLLTRHHVVFR